MTDRRETYVIKMEREANIARTALEELHNLEGSLRVLGLHHRLETVSDSLGKRLRQMIKEGAVARDTVYGRVNRL